ncbi:addiction module antidote protein [Methylotuvimicrobium buryatense]|uniref:Addiction module antidote protein n=1 Tax=Methylotuvimicrobium buryatense TaxID=95641 RepID=A0A4V1IK82_METBY|nr:addiction module antidote protein [Methylotuvimicrobium buryatense]QCW83995.1 putative addiction module antidote protein [Methylotuvimicrobium buryatense]
MTTETKPFNFASGIESKEDMALYLSAFLEENGIEGLTQALGHLAKAKGMSETAMAAGLNRQSLYRTLASEGKPKFETIDKVIHALGFKLTIQSL